MSTFSSSMSIPCYAYSKCPKTLTKKKDFPTTQIHSSALLGFIPVAPDLAWTPAWACGLVSLFQKTPVLVASPRKLQTKVTKSSFNDHSLFQRALRFTGSSHSPSVHSNRSQPVGVQGDGSLQCCHEQKVSIQSNYVTSCDFIDKTHGLWHVDLRHLIGLTSLFGHNVRWVLIRRAGYMACYSEAVCFVDTPHMTTENAIAKQLTASSTMSGRQKNKTSSDFKATYI